MSAFLQRIFGGSGPTETIWIEPHDLKRRLNAGDAVLVLDVRGSDEFTGPLGHIAGAVNLPLPELSAHLTELSAEGRPLVVVCRTDKRSAQAASELAASGHRRVAVLRGGMEAWRRGGFDQAG